MSVALVVLLLGPLVAGISAAIGVAAATVSQHELTRWVAYKLRGSAATAGVLQNPGPTIAAANMLTTLGVLLAAGATPALLAATTPTFLGIFTVMVGVPLFISAPYPGWTAWACCCHPLFRAASVPRAPRSRHCCRRRTRKRWRRPTKWRSSPASWRSPTGQSAS